MNTLWRSCQRIAFGLALLAAAALPTTAASVGRWASMKPDWFRSDEGRQVMTNILSWQADDGAWPKNQDNSAAPANIRRDRISGTFDNGATLGELRVLAAAFRATGDPHARDAWRRGTDVLLKAQYPSGGWPQRYPPGTGYHRHITFNDGTMIGILTWIRDVRRTSVDEALLGDGRLAALDKAFDQGVACVLRCQVKVNGRRTGWGAQHDAMDLALRPARTFEPISLAVAESAGVLRFLMELEKPTPEIVAAVNDGVAWLLSVRVPEIRQETGPDGKRVVAAPGAIGLWPRFCEYGSNRPIFCGRDGVIRYALAEVPRERRDGYAWYGDWGQSVETRWKQWSRERAR
jgi:PelA/Pel-15E family pectate lyase